LQAADILLYDAESVPVGEDQRQHIEVTRDIAQRFNSMFGPIFVLPEPMIRLARARIMGLDDPTVKMSKSLGEIHAGHSIGIIDSPDDIRQKLKAAVTDSGREIRFEGAGAGVSNLLTMYEVLSGLPRFEIEALFRGKGYGALKSDLAELVIESLRPIRERFEQLIHERSYLVQVTREGANRARELASRKMAAVAEVVGIIRQLQ
jgi:tryptophanyl-tRNA synthetase